MKVLVIGKSTFDTSLIIEGYPKENYKYIIKEKHEAPGGSAFTSASLLSLWGIDTYFSGVIGKDEAGSKIYRYAREIALNTNYLIKKNIQTYRNCFIINKYNSTSTVLNDKISDDSIEKVDYNIKPDIILVDTEHYKLAEDAFSKFEKSIKVLNLYNINENTLKLCHKSDYIICSKEFAEIICKERMDYKNPDSLKRVLNEICNIYNAEVIITLGDKGCLYRVDDKIKIMGAIKVITKDSSYARDIFAGAFTYGISKGLIIEKCLKIATIASGLSVKKVGGTLSIPDILDVHKIYAKNE